MPIVYNSAATAKNLQPGCAGTRICLRFLTHYWICVVAVLGSLVYFLLSIPWIDTYVLPPAAQSFRGFTIFKSNASTQDCDAFDGQWVAERAFPLYSASQCPFVEQGFDCLGNGREDMHYLKWRWKPSNCDIMVNMHDILVSLRSQRIVLVGDSMSRTQWESLVCLLMTEVNGKDSVHEIYGNSITKQIRHLAVHFNSFNLSIEFFRSVFLVQRDWMPVHSPKRVRSTVRLDKMDDISDQWIDSDVLVFNTGHWWVRQKLFARGCYFQHGRSVKLGMPIHVAFRMAMKTWAMWIKSNINTNRTRIFFRTYEPSHWSRDNRDSCNTGNQSLMSGEQNEGSIFTNSVIDAVSDVKIPVTLLNVTWMSALRSDAHVGMWSDNPAVVDCSHWCLPGVPDAWNEILLYYLS